ncbi:hypothetical protein EDL79_03010 [Ehrlichia ruminantium]|uniref:Glutamine amidotransferase domain-containing protein n=1 Tax=Ehrlichia ruminantium TaxID=779 RepID=A0AAE6UJL3_EHRRU|nr:gamma-glutamyl-gamma-aminobutyrate hydrolase family protein [Ehrlichia ruminantium]QGR02601.1 hypothetical protein EDL81_03000 [Ehrlichia ruminantium]QGR03521.1 hypothetical protein EDL80_03000 [Ehrlichia ruminantium]QGR04448.1 hypothetical protein EDL79_03010 [Ehrlichia ruminantium]
MRFISRIKNVVVICLICLILPYQKILAGCIRYDQKDVVVGLLSTKVSTYPNEDRTAAQITKVLQSYGAYVVLMDYNVIVKSVENEIIRRNNSYNGENYQISRNDIIEEVVAEFIEKNHINRILIPGNHYNISSLPIAPTSNRQLITNAIVKIVNKNHCIHLFGICGGLQGIMYASGIKISRVQNMVNSHISAASHVVSMPDPRSVDTNLHKVLILPDNRLLGILNALNYKLHVEDKQMVIYVPDAHSEAVDNSMENVERMYSLGYKIIALSEDGIIEAIEDKYGNIYVQFHPEYLLVNVEKKRAINNTELHTSIIIADAIIRDFLYRE